MNNKKDWLEIFSQVFNILMKVFLGFMFAYSFVASLHYMVVSAGNIAFAKNMILFFYLSLWSCLIYFLLRLIKILRDKLVNKDSNKVLEFNKSLKSYISNINSKRVKK